MSERTSPRESTAIVDLVQATAARKIIEFGSWHGRSAIAFLNEATVLDSNATITCVDTWLGSREHWSGSAGQEEWSFANLKIEDGEPRFIETFRQAIQENGYAKNVRILRCPTAFSEFWLAKHAANPDLFYIDADHSTGAVVKDIAIASRITSRGLICGDDWNWTSVKRAVTISAIRLKAAVFGSPDQTAWAIGKPDQSVFTNVLQQRGWQKVVLLSTAWGLIASRLRRIGRSLFRTRKP